MRESYPIFPQEKAVSQMPDHKKTYTKILSEAKSPAGVRELIKVYERFQEANAITEEYLRLISPQTHQSNSNKSLLENFTNADLGRNFKRV